MIKFVGAGKTGAVYGLGLSDADIDQLRAGGWILVDLFELGGPAITIAILTGPTDEAIEAGLARDGLVGENTQIRTDAPRKE